MNNSLFLYCTQGFFAQQEIEHIDFFYAALQIFKGISSPCKV